MTDTLQSLLATIGLFVMIGALGRYAIIFLQDAYYDAMEHNRARKAKLPVETEELTRG